MKYCEKCGNKLDYNVNFCTAWGNKITDTNVIEPKKNIKQLKLPPWAIILIILFIIFWFIIISIFSTDNINNNSNHNEIKNHWAEYYNQNSNEIVEVQQDILYKYGKYYANKMVTTTVKIDSLLSDSIKVNTENNSSFFYSLYFNFADSEEIKYYNEDEYVTIIGTVKEVSSWKTVTLNDCHIIKSGTDAKTKFDEEEKNKNTYEEYAKNLKEQYSAQKAVDEENKKNTYKSECETIDYNSVQRNPDSFKNKKMQVTGRVIQVSAGWLKSVTLRVEDNNYNVWYIDYKYQENESQLIEGDNVTVYGKSTGVTTYESVIGSSVTIPSIKAKYIDIN